MSADNTSMPYQEITDDEYARKAAAAFVLRETVDGVVLLGPCPRCGDPMQYTWADKAPYRGFGAAGGQSKIPMLCTCEVVHEGGAEPGDGCGAYWNLAVE